MSAEMINLFQFSAKKLNITETHTKKQAAIMAMAHSIPAASLNRPINKTNGSAKMTTAANR